MPLVVERLLQDGDPGRVVLRDESSSFTAAELARRVTELATQLQGLGIERLALHADNGTAWVLADLACLEAGILCVPLPHFFTHLQLQHALHACGITAVLTREPNRFAAPFTAAEGIAGLPLTLLLQPHARRPRLPEGSAKVTFTSGSTGTPKGVCLGGEQLLRQAAALKSAVGLQAPVHLCALPLSTLLENVAGVYAPLMAGGTVELRALDALGFTGSRLTDPDKFLRALSMSRPDTLILIPQLLRLLVQAARGGWQAPPFRFIAVGGSGVCATLITEAHALGLPVYEGYGLSECASVVSLNTPGASLPGSCGRVLPQLTVTVQEGEILVGGNAMLGYVDEPGSWYRKRIATGDLGHLDAQGFLHIDGRAGNVLISSYGRNISPEWVESELLASPLLAEAVVLGEARPHCVALLGPARAGIDDVALGSAVAIANARLPDYAQVKAWSRLPRPLSADGLLTANGRPRRARIRARYHAEIEALYQERQARREPELLA